MTEQSAGSDGAVVLIMDANTETGCQLARALLQTGYRVAVTDRDAAGLARIMHGHNASRVMAVAADASDPKQRAQLVARFTRRFGRIDAVIRPGTTATPDADYLLSPSAPLLSRCKPNPPCGCPESVPGLMRLTGLGSSTDVPDVVA